MTFKSSLSFFNILSDYENDKYYSFCFDQINIFISAIEINFNK